MPKPYNINEICYIILIQLQLTFHEAMSLASSDKASKNCTAAMVRSRASYGSNSLERINQSQNMNKSNC